MRGNDDVIRPHAALLLRALAIAIVVATVLAVLGASQSHAYYAVNGGTPPAWTQSLLWSAAQWYAWALLVPWVVLAGLRFNFSGGEWLPGRILLHGLFALCFALIHLLIQASLLWFMLPGGRRFLGSFGAGILTLLATTLQWELLSYAVILAATHVALYVRRAQSEALARRELEAQTARAQLGVLKRQMQPHFLFNALNALVSMQRENSPEQRFTIQLAEVLRLLLEGGDSASATLASELSMVEAYLRVERVRLGARLRAVVEAPESLSETRLPSFILQPLVENAIKHGVACDPEGGDIHVQARRVGPHVVIEVTNTWRMRRANPSRGLGIALDNCRRRLELMYGAAASFDARPLQADEFRATILVPLSVAGDYV